jgi:hypothetical protein
MNLIDDVLQSEAFHALSSGLLFGRPTFAFLPHARQCFGSLMGTLGMTALRWLRANELQRFFTQHVGIALAVTGKFDELVGDAPFNVVVAGPDPQSDANHFEGNP